MNYNLQNDFASVIQNIDGVMSVFNDFDAEIIQS